MENQIANHPGYTAKLNYCDESHTIEFEKGDWFSKKDYDELNFEQQAYFEEVKKNSHQLTPEEESDFLFKNFPGIASTD